MHAAHLNPDPEVLAEPLPDGAGTGVQHTDGFDVFSSALDAEDATARLARLNDPYRAMSGETFARNTNVWYHVQVADGTTGWIFGAYLTPETQNP